MSIDSTVLHDLDQPLSAHGPQDLLLLLPYVIGFHPADSFVVVGLRRQRLVLAARSDLDDARSPHLVKRLVQALIDAEAREAIAIVYSDDRVDTDALSMPHGELVAQFGEAADGTGLTFVDALLVSQRRWWSYCCMDDSCCPAEGQLLDTGPPSAVETAATVAGLVALPDRATLAAQLDPAPMTERQALQPLLARHENESFEAVLTEHTPRWHRSMVRALFAAARRADGGDLALSDDQVARFGVGLSQVEVRDSVWMAIDEGRLDGRELWRLLGKRLPAPYDAAPLFLVGWIAWREGNGALASIAAHRAVESDERYTPADLLLAAISAAVDPRRLPRIRPARLRLPRTA